MDATMTIKSLAELAEKAATETLYVRWEVTGSAGIKRGYSLNHITGGREAGVSVNSLMLDSLEWLACSVLEYRGVCGNVGWIVTGEEVGRGSDNEPILANVRIVGSIEDAVIEEADALQRIRFARQDAERAARVTWTPPASYGSRR